MALALTALVAGLVVGSAAETESDRAARYFARAWERADYAAMHDLLSAGAREDFPLRSFRAAYENALSVATATAVSVGRPAR